MRTLAYALLALALAGCSAHECQETADSDHIALDRESSAPDCPPSKDFIGTCSDGCNTWTCDGSGMCLGTSLYCPKDGETIWERP